MQLVFFQAFDVAFELFVMLLLPALFFLFRFLDFAQEGVGFAGKRGEAQCDHVLADNSPVFCERAIAMRALGMLDVDDGMVGVFRRSLYAALEDVFGQLLIRLDFSFLEVVVASPYGSSAC